MSHGGRRSGSGRKSNAEIKTIRALLDQSIDQARWRALVDKIWGRALRGDIRAAQLLLSYRYGDPYAAEPEQGKSGILVLNLPGPCPNCGYDEVKAAGYTREQLQELAGDKHNQPHTA